MLYICSLLEDVAGIVLYICSLLEEVLSQFEEEYEGYLVVATFCLLEVSASGLLQSELLQLLALDNLMPPSPFDEKGKVKIKIHHSSNFIQE